MNLPVEVIEAVEEARCVLFLGSRASKEAAEEAGGEYPDATALAKALGWKPPRKMMGTRTKQVAPSVLEGAANLEASEGRATLVARMQALLATDAPPTAAHTIALRRFPLIFTTTHDDLLERAAAGLGGTPKVIYPSDVPPTDPDVAERVIVKLWGGFERPDGLLLTRADLAANPMSTEARKAIRTLLRRKVVFFVGYRPDEEAFEVLWEVLTDCYGGELPRCHLAVAQGKIDDFLWQKWVWRGLLMFTADPVEGLQELEARIS